MYPKPELITLDFDFDRLYISNKLMYIPNDDTHKITAFVDYNNWLEQLYTLFNEPTKHNSIKSPQYC